MAALIVNMVMMLMLWAILVVAWWSIWNWVVPKVAPWWLEKYWDQMTEEDRAESIVAGQVKYGFFYRGER